MSGLTEIRRPDWLVLPEGSRRRRGLVIFMILAFDRPFRGDLGLSPDAYQEVYDVVMQDPR